MPSVQCLLIVCIWIHLVYLMWLTVPANSPRANQSTNKFTNQAPSNSSTNQHPDRHVGFTTFVLDNELGNVRALINSIRCCSGSLRDALIWVITITITITIAIAIAITIITRVS